MYCFGSLSRSLCSANMENITYIPHSFSAMDLNYGPGDLHSKG